MTKLLSALCAALYLSSTAAADDLPDIQASFRASLEAGCVQGLVKKAVDDYARMTAARPDSISSAVHAKIEKVLEPLYGWCACVARKASARVTSESDKKLEIAVDLTSFRGSPECTPDLAAKDVVWRDFTKLVEASPPAISSLKTKRVRFSLTVTMNNALPSVFAAYAPPPETLTKLGIVPKQVDDFTRA